MNNIYRTNNCGDLEVLKRLGNKAEVRFIKTGYITTVYMSEVYRGRVSDKLLPSCKGVGIIGGTKTKCKTTGKHFKYYQVWANMLERCYCENYQEKKPTYRYCTVSEDFKYLGAFKIWCEGSMGYENNGWHLDKDILVRGNKVYSPETCCFVPKELNMLLLKGVSWRGNGLIGVSYHKGVGKYNATLSVGGKHKHLGHFNNENCAFQAYKKAKEDHIKEVANKWKDKIDPRAYEALMNYQVEITD